MNKLDEFRTLHFRYFGLFFLVIIAIAFCLRLWGIWNVSSTDEYNEVLEALRVCSGNLNFERWMKRFYLYILSLEYGIYYICGWIVGNYGSPIDFAEKIVRNMEPLFIMGRLTSVVAGTLTVGVIYRIGSKFHNNLTAITASLLMTFTVFHINLSQQAKVDATLGLFIVLSLYFLYKLLESYKVSKWDYIFCGLCMALAVQTKINAVVLVFPLALVVFLSVRKKNILRNLLYYFFPAGILGLILGNPAVAIAPVKFFYGVLSVGNVYTTAVNEVPSEMIGFVGYPVYFFRTMGLVASVLTVLALLWAVYKPSRQRWLLLSFIIPFYLLMGATENLVYVYYMIPVVPFLYLMIGDTLNEILVKLQTKISLTNQKLALLASIVLILALIQPILNVYAHERSLLGPNTRYVAKQWIEENIPPDSRILMDSGKSINSFAPDIARNEKSIKRRLDRAKENVKQGKIVHEMVNEDALIYYEMLYKTVPELAYDITSTGFGLSVKSIDYYVENGFDYFIISQGMKESRTSKFFRKKNPKIASFYESLNNSDKVDRIKTIAPTKYNKGITYLIYKVNKS